VLICPASDHDKAIGKNVQEIAANAKLDAHHSYVYLGKDLVKPIADDLVIAYERPGNHDDGMNILFADGETQWIDAAATKLFLKEISLSGNRPTTMPR